MYCNTIIYYSVFLKFMNGTSNMGVCWVYLFSVFPTIQHILKVIASLCVGRAMNPEVFSE